MNTVLWEQSMNTVDSANSSDEWTRDSLVYGAIPQMWKASYTNAMKKSLIDVEKASKQSEA